MVLWDNLEYEKWEWNYGKRDISTNFPSLLNEYMILLFCLIIKRMKWIKEECQDARTPLPLDIFLAIDMKIKITGCSEYIF